MKRLNLTPWLIGLGAWLVAVIASIYVYDALPPQWVDGRGFVQTGDPYAVLRSAIRIIVLAPLCVSIALGSVLLWDKVTPDNLKPGALGWLISLTDDQHGNLGTKLATGIVLAAIILGVFWVGVSV